VLFSTILFCRFLLHPKMSLEDALHTMSPLQKEYFTVAAQRSQRKMS